MALSSGGSKELCPGLRCHVNNTFKLIWWPWRSSLGYPLGIIPLHLLRLIRAWQGMGLILCLVALIPTAQSPGQHGHKSLKRSLQERACPPYPPWSLAFN